MAQSRPPTPIGFGHHAERTSGQLTAQTDARWHRLPVPITRFIGREREAAEITRLLETARLLTLTGSGGCGKTRLALAVATAYAATAPNGVCLIELAGHLDGALVPEFVALALDVREEPHRPLVDTLMDALSLRPPLLLLDNCEHLVNAVAELTDALLQACPDLRVFATSREALRVSGEVTWPVPSLSLPVTTARSAAQMAESEAVQLFVDRVRLRQPTFTLTDAHAAAVAAICRQLDGMPLALELAAARASVLTIPQLATRLDDALPLLTQGGRTVAPRHQTLRATLDWSYDLLTESERAMLRHLGVFAGGCDLAAVEAICTGDRVAREEVLPLLAQLVEKSLVQVEERDGEARYLLLETVRQYAQEQLATDAEVEQLRERHTDWYLAFVEHAAPGLVGPEQGRWIALLEREHDNLRAVLRRLSDKGDAERGLCLARGLWRFWEARSHLSEGGTWLTMFLSRYREELPSPPPILWLDALFGAGRIAFLHGEYETARTLLEELLTAARAGENQVYAAFALNHLGHLAFYELDFPLARALYAEGLALRRTLGNPYHIAISLGSLGQVALIERAYDEARDVLEESLSLYRQAGVMFHMTATLRWLGLLAIEQHDPQRARTHFTESLKRSQESHAQWRTAESLEGFAMIAAMEGQPARAMRLAGAATRFRTVTGEPPVILWRERLEQFLAPARTALGETASAELYAAGQAMTIEAVIAEALATPPPGQPGDVATHPAPSGEIRRAAKARYGGLTAREREIATLIAVGKLNREIADSLFVTEKTVEWHISNSLRKLGFRTRAELAVWAVVADLAPPPHAPRNERAHS